MRRLHCAVVATLVVLTGCAAESPDYQSIWSTSPTTTTPAPDAGAAVPLAAYLENAGVTGTQVPAIDQLTDLTVTFPTPPGWQPYQNPNFAPGTEVIAEGDSYPIAMLMVFRLDGDFDLEQAFTHVYGDAERSENFTRLNASTADFESFPSAMIEGSYDLNGRRMHSYNRVVFPTGAAPANHRYLVQFTVTGYAEKAAEEAPDIEAIIDGFTVARPTTPPK